LQYECLWHCSCFGELQVRNVANDERIHVVARQSVVTLEGDAPSAPQKKMAEFDARYVFGVGKVVNRRAVRP
jgi:osmotically-inducible protein OsmY